MGDPEFLITLLQSVKWSLPVSLVSGCHGLNETSLPPLHKGGSRNSEEGRDLSKFMEEQWLEFSSHSHKNTAQIGVTNGNRDQRPFVFIFLLPPAQGGEAGSCHFPRFLCWQLPWLVPGPSTSLSPGKGSPSLNRVDGWKYSDVRPLSRFRAPGPGGGTVPHSVYQGLTLCQVLCWGRSRMF